jgi:DNA-directed RNA polymerase specialized sigma24 family protein
MFASRIGMEEDDLAQELRIKVWSVIPRYDPARSPLTLERYVFGALTNKIKDFKRGAGREAKRRVTFGVEFLHIEDMRGWDDLSRQEAFDGQFHFVEREEVFSQIEEGRFVLPAGVTHTEARVLVLLMTDHTKSEIALRLGITKTEVFRSMTALREKFADWRPSRPNSSQVVEISTVQTVRAEDQLVGSRAA